MWPFKNKRTPEEQAVAKRIVEGVFSGEYQLSYYKDKTTIYRGARKTSPFRARMNSATAKPF